MLMEYAIVKLAVYLLCFLVSLFALSGVRFDRFVNVRQPDEGAGAAAGAGDGARLSLRQFFCWS